MVNKDGLIVIIDQYGSQRKIQFDIENVEVLLSKENAVLIEDYNGSLVKTTDEKNIVNLYG